MTKFILPICCLIACDSVWSLQLRRDCSASDNNCISALPVTSSSYNPGTIATSTDASGMLSVEAVAGDLPMDAPPDTSKSDADYALKFTIESPKIIEPDPAPALIVCQVGNCPTTTTPIPVAR